MQRRKDDMKAEFVAVDKKFTELTKAKDEANKKANELEELFIEEQGKRNKLQDDFDKLTKAMDDKNLQYAELEQKLNRLWLFRIKEKLAKAETEVRQVAGDRDSEKTAKEEAVESAELLNAIKSMEKGKLKAASNSAQQGAEDDEAESSSSDSEAEDESQERMKWKDIKTGLPFFGGNATDDVVSWFFLIEDAFVACRVTGNSKVQLAKTLLRGSALTMYMTLAENKPPSYDTFKKEFLSMYQPFDILTTAREELGTLKQVGNNFDEFVRKVQKLITRLTDACENEKIYFFKHGLGKNAGERVRERQPRTLADAMRIAGSYEKSIQSMNQPQRPKFQGKREDRPGDKQEGQNKVSCWNCGRVGHQRKDCRDKPRNLANFNKDKPASGTYNQDFKGKSNSNKALMVVSNSHRNCE